MFPKLVRGVAVEVAKPEGQNHLNVIPTTASLFALVDASK